MHDFIPAVFTCPSCKLEDDCSLQTHLFDGEGRAYRVGDAVEVQAHSLPDDVYLSLERGDDLEPGHISALEIWYCRECGACNIARLDVDEGKITGVQSIELSPETLAPVTRVQHHISRAQFVPVLRSMFAALTDEHLMFMSLNDRIEAIVSGRLPADFDEPG